MRLLLLWLEAPLMSFGGHSKWDDRDSEAMPTRSMLLGMIACCMGLKRGEPELERMHRALELGIRGDRQGRMITDFQTIQGMRSGLLNAEGVKRGGGNTFISRRQYIEDAAFFVAISGGDALLDDCCRALRNPVWPPFLGRKSCPPTVPICIGIREEYDSIEDAMRRYPIDKRASKHIVTYIEDAKGAISRMTRLVDASNRTFTQQRIRTVAVDVTEEVRV